MLFLSFENGTSVDVGIDLSTLADSLKNVKQASLASNQALFHWRASSGQGRLSVEREGEPTQEHDMPLKKARSRTSLALLITLPCVLRLAPEGKAGCTVNIAGSGAYTVAAGADAPLPSILPDTVDATPMERAARQWLRNGPVGSSSYALCVGLTGVTDPQRDPPDTGDIPWDASDLGRCLTFFKAVPEARALLDKMSDQGPLWAALVPVWGELENYAKYGENASIQFLIAETINGILPSLNSEEVQYHPRPTGAKP